MEAMQTRTAQRVAWPTLGLTVVLAASDGVFALLNRSTTSVDSIGVPGQAAILAVVVGVLGTAMTSRLPRNAIGWLFSAVGLGLALTIFSQDYAIWTLVTAPGSLPAGEFMAWLGSWLPAAGGVVAFLMLLFPDGHLLSRRWRPLALIAAADFAALTILTAFMTAPPGPEDLLGFNGPRNVSAAAIVGLSFLLSFLVAVLVTLASAGAMLLRLSRARGHERQQLKWFVYTTSVLALTVLVPNLPLDLIPTSLSRWMNALVLLAFGGMPIAAGVAILRYRLYDIDLIINRTLVYSALTITLGSVYYAIVVLLQQVVSDRLASSQLMVAGSTLCVAALFRPARSRIQGAVDRRFNRRRYDAERTVDAFGATLRQEVDLDRLTQHLLEVVGDTMEPTHVSIWLEAPNGVRSGDS